MKKTIYLLNVGDYQPEITKLTYPFIDLWATKIGADVHVIKSRKFPEWDMDYEKLQIYDLAESRDDDWSIYIDSDALVHPDTPDFTELIPKDMVAHHGVDFAPYRFKYDDIFRRDGRHIGSCNWFAMASDWTRDLWKPLKMLPDEAYEQINIINVERLVGLPKEHLVSDYALSHNIAEYGLKFTTIKEVLTNFKQPDNVYFHHIFCVSEEEKLKSIKQKIGEWENERIS